MRERNTLRKVHCITAKRIDVGCVVQGESSDQEGGGDNVDIWDRISKTSTTEGSRQRASAEASRIPVAYDDPMGISRSPSLSQLAKSTTSLYFAMKSVTQLLATTNVYLTVAYSYRSAIEESFRRIALKHPYAEPFRTHDSAIVVIGVS
ncbi:unnamed protein product [Anisakis simplex]|uniref:Longin domain-containing protein n=1 Tax=Anisakis simplex TaxID=6269 RepID=A0A0M3J360_ANISI|nr:unnamed protein product [Anisakis simplex]